MQKPAFSVTSSAYILMILLFSSCTQTSNPDEDIQQMEESLIDASKQINLSTEMFRKALEEKTTDPSTMERAKTWYPKAEQVAQLSNEIYKYLDSVKMKLKETKFSADILYKRLNIYKENVLLIDSSIRQEFSDNFNFSKLFSKTITSSLTTTLQNSVKIIENKIITFCNFKVADIDHGSFYSFSGIVGQNSNYLKPGDLLEIKAGIGAFNTTSRPKININGNDISLGEEGYALYRIKAPQKPGDYKIPVRLSYFNHVTGRDDFMSINVEYTVAKACND